MGCMVEAHLSGSLEYLRMQDWNHTWRRGCRLWVVSVVVVVVVMVF